MFEIPGKYFVNNTIHRNISNDKHNGVLSCGFLNKRARNASDINLTFDYYGALLLLSGEGVHVDCDGKEYKLYPGCFVQRIPGKPHSTYVKPDGNWLEFFICFGRELFEALVHIHLLDDRQDVLYPGVNRGIFDTFTSFLTSMRNARQEQLPMLLNEAQKIIFTIYEMHKRNTIGDEKMEVIKQACLTLDRDPGKRVSLHEVASQLGVGYEMFRKLFREKMGISPGEYIIQGRINRAKTLLIDTDTSVKEIAIELGFPDQFAFSKQFKKVVGVSPTEFKRNC